jgi:predicted P-loop ATPase/GTPase
MDSDAVHRKLRLQQRQIDALQETAQKAQRRADSAWTAVSRLNQASVERSIESATPTPEITNVPPLKAGVSLAHSLRDYNQKVTGGQ